jgi:imidazolonepropionase-like amidohydrolase
MRGVILKHHVIFLFLISVTPFFTLSCDDSQSPSASHDVIALTNGLLIDGTGSDPITEATVLVRDDRIQQVGEGSDVLIPENATTIDLEGATILPGFINAHVHDGFNESNLQVWARNGVTTVRDIGANPYLPLFSTRDELMTNPENARLVCAGPLVTVSGGYPAVPWGSASAYPVASVDEARLEMSNLLDEGADLIKIALERGDIFGEVIPTLSVEMAAEIVRVTHNRGTVVTAHVTAARDLELALDAGVDDIAHMVVTNLSDDLITRLVSNGIYWVPTLELWHGVGYNFPSIAHSNLNRFVQAGGKVALGTDYEGYSSPFDLGMPIREIGWMEEAGMTPMQIIVAGTKNAARVCNLENELGTIEVGKIADILVVNGNPLDDIVTSLTSVQLVMHNGIIIVPETHVN